MAVRANNTADRMSNGATTPAVSAGFSFGSWFYISVDQNINQTICRLSDSGGATIINIATDSDGVSPAAFTVAGSVSSGVAVPVGEWWYIGVTYTPNTLKLILINPAGTVQTFQNAAVTLSAAAAQICLFGRSAADATEWFNGRQQYARAWFGTVLSTAQFQAERNSAVALITSGLWADWWLTDHTDLADHSGAGHHLTPVAALGSDNTEAGPDLGSNILSALLPPVSSSWGLGEDLGGSLVATLPAVQVDLGERPDWLIRLPAVRALPNGLSMTAEQIEMEYERLNTWYFIEADPIDVALSGLIVARLPSGGLQEIEGVARAMQRFRLIPMSHTERPRRGTNAAGNESGMVRRHDFTLLGMWDADIRKNDFWDDENGDRCVVDSIIPFNGYQQKAMITLFRQGEAP